MSYQEKKKIIKFSNSGTPCPYEIKIFFHNIQIIFPVRVFLKNHLKLCFVFESGSYLHHHCVTHKRNENAPGYTDGTLPKNLGKQVNQGTWGGGRL